MTAQRWGSQCGFNIVETMFVLGILGILASVATVQINASRPGLKGDGAMRIVLSQMNQARELAITQRRNMRVTFDNGNRVQVLREDGSEPTLTVVSSAYIEGGLQFTLVAGLPDTPDAFGNPSAVAFGDATQIKFNPDGWLVSQTGGPLNGTVFVAMPNVKNSARAVTVLGSTGRVRGYRWDGRIWKLV